MPQHTPTSYWLRRAGWNVVISPDGHPLRMHGRSVGLEVTELLMLFGVQPQFTTSFFWRLVKATILVPHIDVLTKLLVCLLHKRQPVSHSKTAPSIDWADSNSLNRSNDVGLRNREENGVLPERCDCRPTSLKRCFEFRCVALNLSRYRKTGLSAESQSSSQMPWD